MIYIKKDVKAFTLVEILVVMAIMSTTILMSATFIKYQQPTMKLYTASQTLRNHLRKARQYTLTNQITHAIHFSIEENSYELLDLSGQTELEIFTLSSNIQFNAPTTFTDNQVSFNATGAASQSGIIILKNSRGDTKTITVNPSGYIKVE